MWLSLIIDKTFYSFIRAENWVNLLWGGATPISDGIFNLYWYKYSEGDISFQILDYRGLKGEFINDFKLEKCLDMILLLLFRRAFWIGWVATWGREQSDISNLGFAQKASQESVIAIWKIRYFCSKSPDIHIWGKSNFNGWLANKEVESLVRVVYKLTNIFLQLQNQSKL